MKKLILSVVFLSGILVSCDDNERRLPTSILRATSDQCFNGLTYCDQDRLEYKCIAGAEFYTGEVCE